MQNYCQYILTIFYDNVNITGYNISLKNNTNISTSF